MSKFKGYPRETTQTDVERIISSDVRKMKQLLAAFDLIVPKNRISYYKGWGETERFYDLDHKIKQYRKLLSNFGKVKGIYNLYQSIIKDEKTD